MTTTTTDQRPRTDCPTCGRNVSFVTDLAYKYLTRHKRPDGSRWCSARRVEVPA